MIDAYEYEKRRLGQLDYDDLILKTRDLLADQVAFTVSGDPNKRQRWADRWLASYAFGERWASFWLPVARYAEDQAHQVGSNASLTYPNAHLYRQYHLSCRF